MDWSGKKVFVTGGAGFLGSNLCHALAARGARVRYEDACGGGGATHVTRPNRADWAAPMPGRLLPALPRWRFWTSSRKKS